MDVGVPSKSPLGDVGHLGACWKIDVGWFMLVVLRSWAWGGIHR